MKKMFKTILSSFFVFVSLQVCSQEKYLYTINLNDVSDDVLEVELHTPAIKQSTAVFSMPKIIPGTYRIADYGKFVNEVKAFDKKRESTRRKAAK